MLLLLLLLLRRRQLQHRTPCSIIVDSESSQC
jgi:hypothetical protein